MNKLLFFLFLTVSFIVKSQEVENDTTFFKWGNTKIIIIDDSSKTDKKTVFRGHYAGFSVGVNFLDVKNEAHNSSAGFVNSDVLELDQIRSWEVNFDVFQHSFNLYRNHFGIVTGLGFKFNNYRFKNNYRIISSADSIYAVTDTINDFYKTKMTISKIRIPLIFEWQDKLGRKNRPIYFSIGVFGSYNIISYMKYNYKIDGQKIKEKYYNNYQLNSFQYGMLVRFGYGIFEFYAEYNISEMFKDNKAVVANPFSVGIIILNF